MTDTEWPDFEDVIDPVDVPVPGSRPRVKHERREHEPKPEQPWDAHPKVLRVDGVEMELFGSTALCLALGINNEQLKHWERRGWIPKTNVRLPRKGQNLSPRLANGGGGVIPGRRLYTRAFIQGMVRIANSVPPSTEMGEQALDLYYQTMPGEPA